MTRPVLRSDRVNPGFPLRYVPGHSSRLCRNAGRDPLRSLRLDGAQPSAGYHPRLMPPRLCLARCCPTGQTAQNAAWLSAVDHLSASASRLSTARPIDHDICHLASCRRAVAVPAAAIRRPSRPVRFAAGITQLSHAKVEEALDGFPCFAAIRLAPSPAFRPAVSFRACAASRRAEKRERRRRPPSSVAFAFPCHATAPVPWRVSVALNSE